MIYINEENGLVVPRERYDEICALRGKSFDKGSIKPVSSKMVNSLSKKMETLPDGRSRCTILSEGALQGKVVDIREKIVADEVMVIVSGAIGSLLYTLAQFVDCDRLILKATDAFPIEFTILESLEQLLNQCDVVVEAEEICFSKIGKSADLESVSYPHKLDITRVNKIPLNIWFWRFLRKNVVFPNPSSSDGAQLLNHRLGEEVSAGVSICDDSVVLWNTDSLWKPNLIFETDLVKQHLKSGKQLVIYNLAEKVNIDLTGVGVVKKIVLLHQPYGSTSMEIDFTGEAHINEIVIGNAVECCKIKIDSRDEFQINRIRRETISYINEKEKQLDFQLHLVKDSRLLVRDIDCSLDGISNKPETTFLGVRGDGTARIDTIKGFDGIDISSAKLIAKSIISEYIYLADGGSAMVQNVCVQNHIEAVSKIKGIKNLTFAFSSALLTAGMDFGGAVFDTVRIVSGVHGRSVMKNFKAKRLVLGIDLCASRFNPFENVVVDELVIVGEKYQDTKIDLNGISANHISKKYRIRERWVFEAHNEKQPLQVKKTSAEETTRVLSENKDDGTEQLAQEEWRNKMMLLGATFASGALTGVPPTMSELEVPKGVRVDLEAKTTALRRIIVDASSIRSFADFFSWLCTDSRVEEVVLRGDLPSNALHRTGGWAADYIKDYDAVLKIEGEVTLSSVFLASIEEAKGKLILHNATHIGVNGLKNKCRAVKYLNFETMDAAEKLCAMGNRIYKTRVIRTSDGICIAVGSRTEEVVLSTLLGEKTDEKITIYLMGLRRESLDVNIVLDRDVDTIIVKDGTHYETVDIQGDWRVGVVRMEYVPRFLKSSCRLNEVQYGTTLNKQRFSISRCKYIGTIKKMNSKISGYEMWIGSHVHIGSVLDAENVYFYGEDVKISRLVARHIGDKSNQVTRRIGDKSYQVTGITVQVDEVYTEQVNFDKNGLLQAKRIVCLPMDSRSRRTKHVPCILCGVRTEELAVLMPSKSGIKLQDVVAKMAYVEIGDYYVTKYNFRNVEIDTLRVSGFCCRVAKGVFNGVVKNPVQWSGVLIGVEGENETLVEGAKEVEIGGFKGYYKPIGG